MEPILEFTSHIAGKNAKVRLFTDRVEWERVGRMGSASKATLGVFTLGASLAVTGVGRKRETEMVPIRSISGVSTKKDGPLNTRVVLGTPAGELGFRISHREAERFASEVRRLILEAHA